MSEKDLDAPVRDKEESARPVRDTPATPLYQKPVLRVYDQIEQVKPYGPSEMEAG